MMPHTILHDVHIRADISSVFDSITEPKHLNNWWTKKCSGVAEKGSKYNLYFTEEFDWYGEVTNCVPDKSFAITMTKSDADWDYTTFGFEIESIDESITRLRFYHKDWKDTNHHYRRTSYCWALLLNNLREYLEVGTIIPFENRSDA
jgi:uncharacterized protein YndB with AHSA1/START domain